MLWLKALHLIFMVTWFAGLSFPTRISALLAESGSLRLKQVQARLRSLRSRHDHPWPRKLSTWRI